MVSFSPFFIAYACAGSFFISGGWEGEIRIPVEIEERVGLGVAARLVDDADVLPQRCMCGIMYQRAKSSFMTQVTSTLDLPEGKRIEVSSHATALERVDF